MAVVPIQVVIKQETARSHAERISRPVFRKGGAATLQSLHMLVAVGCRVTL